jgi:hypothetical protein
VFEKRWQEEKRAAEDDSKKSLDDAQARFDEAVRQIREDASLDEQAKEVKIVRVQQQENRKLDPSLPVQVNIAVSRPAASLPVSRSA